MLKLSLSPEGRRRTTSFLALAALASASCGALPPRPKGEAPAKKSLATTPLVPFEVANDEDVARAIREYYTKYEYRIPMRDGVKLHTHVYVPKDDAHVFPMMLQRTPYGVPPYGVDNGPVPSNSRVLRRFAPHPAMIREGYVFVHQDVRGKMMSEGTFVDVRPHRAAGANGPNDVDETTDAFDTVDFLVKNVPRNSGDVGVWGISYPGFYAAQAAISGHPAIKAVSPQAPVTEWFLGDDFHHNGAFFLAEAFDFYSSFGKVRPKPVPKATWGFDYGTGDLYDFFLRLGPLARTNEVHFEGKLPFWNDLFAHGSRDDFWKARDPRPHYRAAKPAVLTVGGFFDAEDLWGSLETYKAFETQSPGAKNHLVMGPWRHGGWARSDGDKLGALSFAQKTSVQYHERVEAPFFRKYLKHQGDLALAEATCFETGTNEWRRFDAWPPREAVANHVYFAPQGALSTKSPGTATSGSDAYTSDPKKPVPYLGRPSAEIDATYMVEDQRFASRRPDVLVYESPKLTEDLTLAGPVDVDLWVSTTGTDADFVVKLVDVLGDDAQDPEPNPSGVKMGGYQALVRLEVMRGKFRDGFDAPKPFVPGQPTRVRFSLADVLHTFRPGHRLMVQVQSSLFPLVDRNPQTFCDIYAAKEDDFRPATHTLLRTPEHPSSLGVRVLRGKLPF
ncbi:MAG: CocE/NonD family hydrolase [Myxococcales bacterium]|nr:CocE/NonD family hydrolase [Myxococcales bacterium]